MNRETTRLVIYYYVHVMHNAADLSFCVYIYLTFQAILGRKLVCGEVFELMQKICELSVTSDSEHVRQQCRQVSQHVM